MKLKRFLTALLLAGPLVWVFAAQAGTTTFQGVNVDYGSASTNWVGGELVLSYKNSSTLVISDGAVRADILVVGGGGSGGRSDNKDTYYGSGSGGSVTNVSSVTLPKGEYEITVGAGGAAVTMNSRTGNDGSSSSIKGPVNYDAAGGAGGGNSAKAGSGAGVASEITGTSVTYGKGGVKAFNDATAGKSGAANTGAGGTGNRKGNDSGAGGSGIVVVRLTSVKESDDPPPGEEKTLTVQKTVAWDPDDVSNATIRVWSHVPAAQLDVIAPNVLFIGTMCSAHKLDAATVRKSLNAIASKANVDWYLYPSDYEESRAGSRRHGSLNKGNSLGTDFENDLSMPAANHQALKSFYKTIYDVATDSARSNKYDYIVFEFDGSRLAHKYEKGADYDEAVVARFLTPYYQASNVIWVVDNCSYGTGEPYQGNEYYTPNAYAYGSTVNNFLSDVQYRALIGLMDPDYYFSNTCYTTTREWGSSSYKWTVWTTDKNGKASSTAGVTGKRQVWANRRYEKQITYDDADNLSNYLMEHIVQHSCDLKFVDKVVDAGLTIVTARLYRAESPLGVDEPEGWTEIEPPELKLQICGTVVTAVVERVTKELWAKLEIVARDDGTFKTSEGAVLVDGKWKKNPNDGAANVQMTDETKGEVYAEGDAYTDLDWEDEQGHDAFVAYVIRGVVENGELTINGVKTNELSVSEGYSPVVAYRGDPGCRLETITDATDEGTTAVDVSGHPTEYVVENLRTNHLVTVRYVPVAVDSDPYEGFYDAAGHSIEVNLPEESADLNDFSVKYAFEEEGEYLPADEFGGCTNIGVRTVYYKVYASQTGYDEPQLIASGSNTVTIWPRPVEIWANNTNMTYGAEVPLPTYRVQGDLVDDDGPAVSLTYTNDIWTVGIYPEAITTNAPVVVTNAAGTDISVNYEVIFHPGTLTVTAAPMGIAAFSAEKFYDAEPTNITYVVTNAAGVAIVPDTVSFREKGTAEWIPAAEFIPFVDTTNIIVEVRAEKGGFNPVEAEATVVINPRPVTLVAASDSKAYDGLPLTNWTFTVKSDTTTEGYGFVKDEGVERVTMTPDSTITNPGSQPNEIATEVAKEGTKLERNYIVSTENGTLTVTAAEFTASAASYDEFYDGQEHTIEVEIQKPEEAGEATIAYSYEEGGTYLPIECFEQLKDVTAGGPVTVYAKVAVKGYATVIVSSTVNIKPRIVVEQADSASKTFDGAPLVQPNHHEETDVEAEKSKEKWGTAESLANSIGFVNGEGFADVPMTASSAIIDPGVEDNVIDAAAVTLRENTKAGNYIFHYLPGELAVIQRQEEVRRDPEIVIPDESKEVIEESDRRIVEVLGELAKSDQEMTGEFYVKYQLTVTPTNNLSEATRTSPEEAAADAARQIALFEEENPDAKADKAEFVDIVLERTYDKAAAEEAAIGNYDKDDWEPIDKAEEHGNRILEVTIPIVVPDGMALVGVTRSCVKGDKIVDEVLKQKDPNDPNAEGFVYDPETKTVTLYAYDFCVFGFIMEAESPVLRPDGDEDLCECDARKARTYVGTIIDRTLGVIGSVSVSVSRPNKKGVATVKANVSSRLETGNLSFQSKVAFGDCPCSEEEAFMVIDRFSCCTQIHHELALRFDGDRMTGWIDGDGRIDGGIDVFKSKGDPRRRAIDDRVGTWCGVFKVNELDGTSGFGTLSMSIKKVGTVSIRCKMPDGKSIKTTSKYQVGEDGIGIVPVMFRKAYNYNNVRSFGTRLVFRAEESLPRAYDVSPVQTYSIYSGETSDLRTIQDIQVSRAVKRPLVVTGVTVRGCDNLPVEPDEVKIKVNRMTNALSGKCTWISFNGKGKVVKVSGTVKSGCVVNGVGYGMISIKGMGLLPFTCVCE